MSTKPDRRQALADLKGAWRDLKDEVTPDTPEAPETSTPNAPVKRKWTAVPSAQFSGKNGQLHLFPDGVDHIAGAERATIPLDAIQSVTLEDGADLEARITATRMVLVGVFALALRKRRGGEKYLAIESTDGVAVVEVPRKSIAKAQQFAAKVKTAAKGATA